MAIKLLPYYNLVLRVNVTQEISVDGWKYLMHYCNPNRNFDGEIVVFGAMNPFDIENDMNRLIDFGFSGPENGNEADIVVTEGLFSSQKQLPEWLELVDVRFFDDESHNCRAWKLTNSGVYSLVDFLADVTQPMKGYECDWPPLIGKIR